MRALVLSGGGSRGAFQAGVLASLCAGTEFKSGFEVISGVSVGAINGAMLATQSPRNIDQAAHNLLDLWRINLRSIWNYSFPPLLRMFFSHSVSSNTCLRKLVERHVDVSRMRASGVAFRVSCVDLMSGKPVVFTEQDAVLEAIIASASVPLLFPPVRLGNRLFTDGNVREMAPLASAIACGADEILAISSTNPYNSRAHKEPANALEVLARSLDLMMTEILFNDIEYCNEISARGDDGKRAVRVRVIYPPEDLGSGLDFSRPTIERMIAAGFQAAKVFQGGAGHAIH